MMYAFIPIVTTVKLTGAQNVVKKRVSKPISPPQK